MGEGCAEGIGVHAVPLVTRNVDDFKHVNGLKLINPFDKLNDSRSGVAAYYRYKPRKLADIYALERSAHQLEDSLDSDADQITGKSACIVLGGGETNRTIDAGLVITNCELRVTKTACTTFSDSDCVRVKYTYVVSNTGQSIVNNVTVVDDQLGPVPGSPIATLAPGQSVMLMATNGTVCCSTTNTVTVTASRFCPNTSATGSPPGAS